VARGAPVGAPAAGCCATGPLPLARSPGPGGLLPRAAEASESGARPSSGWLSPPFLPAAGMTLDMASTRDALERRCVDDAAALLVPLPPRLPAEEPEEAAAAMISSPCVRFRNGCGAIFPAGKSWRPAAWGHAGGGHGGAGPPSAVTQHAACTSLAAQAPGERFRGRQTRALTARDHASELLQGVTRATLCAAREGSPPPARSLIDLPRSFPAHGWSRGTRCWPVCVALLAFHGAGGP
jgi:hypothetical protein